MAGALCGLRCLFRVRLSSKRRKLIPKFHDAVSVLAASYVACTDVPAIRWLYDRADRLAVAWPTRRRSRKPCAQRTTGPCRDRSVRNAAPPSWSAICEKSNGAGEQAAKPRSMSARRFGKVDRGFRTLAQVIERARAGHPPHDSVWSPWYPLRQQLYNNCGYQKRICKANFLPVFDGRFARGSCLVWCQLRQATCVTGEPPRPWSDMQFWLWRFRSGPPASMEPGRAQALPSFLTGAPRSCQNSRSAVRIRSSDLFIWRIAAMRAAEGSPRRMALRISSCSLSTAT